MKKHVLVVDDEYDFVFMLKTTLEMTGMYQVRGVTLGTQVLGVAREFKPDLVLLDCMMPGMDGGEVAGAIEADPALKGTPVAFLTATVSDPEMNPSRCYTGVRTYLPKTLPLHKLVQFIEEHAGGKTPVSSPEAQ